MFTGTNPSGLEFDVIDEDGDVLGSFANFSDACACAKAAPWWHGQTRLRRDRATLERRHAAELKYRADAEAAFQAFCYAC
jgi:hypothetical protein